MAHRSNLACRLNPTIQKWFSDFNEMLKEKKYKKRISYNDPMWHTKFKILAIWPFQKNFLILELKQHTKLKLLKRKINQLT